MGCLEPGIGFDNAPMESRTGLAQGLRALGVREGDLLMVHASLRAIGAVDGGPSQILGALLDAVGPGGTIAAFVSWDRSSYEETLNGAVLGEREREAWPAFDPAAHPEPYAEFGALNRFICNHPAVRRSAHPDASFAAIGRRADEITSEHPLVEGYGPGSPLGRIVQAQGRVLLLGAGLDSVTVLHHAEVLADIPGKRRVSYEVPLATPDGKRWVRAENFDTNGILDEFAVPGRPDAVESIARDYVAAGQGKRGRVGGASCRLFEAPHIVDYGVRWLEARFGEAAR
jgi:aminoglycoside N3'-acetyltransferase